MKFQYLLIIFILFLFIVGCDYQYDDSIKEPILESIIISKEPNKTTYFINEDIDLSGLVVEVIYSDNSKKIIDDYKVEYPSINIGINTVVIKYENLETSFDILVKDITITSLNIIKGPSKTSYYIDEDIDLSGLVVEVIYSDNSKKIIDDYKVEYSSINIGINKVIIKYENLETSFDILVKDITITSLNIIKGPSKTSYYIDEDIDLSGLVVEATYSDNSKKIVDDYKVEYPSINIGTNEIIVKYDNLETSFFVNFEDYDRIEINYIVNYSNYSIMNIDFTNFDLRFTDAKYAIRRDKDMMIVYDEDNFIETNIYGYEISVNEYGQVVEVGINVSLVKNGFIVSGHGISSKLLKEVNVGDICVYIDETVYIYKNKNIDRRSKVYLKLIDVINEISIITVNKQYNVYAMELNSIIEQFNEIYDETNEMIDILYDLLCDISDSLFVSLYDNDHSYNYVELNCDLMDKAYEDANNFINFIDYTDKLYYGGFRNQDTIVLYNEQNYRTRNPYGYEIAVDKNNIIIDKQILVDLPEGGYILSGHGTGAEFIKNNLNIGNKVEITDSSIKFYKDLGSNEYNVLISKRNDLASKINEHSINAIPHDYKYIYKLMNYIDGTLSTNNLIIKSCYDVSNVSKCVKKVEACLGVVYSQLIDHKVLETRGMWYYPFTYPAAYDDTTLEGVINTLDMFKEMGFNEIVIIPFSGKYCLFESEYFHYYEQLNEYSYGEYGNDYLTCFITEAHKRGITVNAFTQTFRCYEEGSKVFDESHYQLQYDGTLSMGQIYYYDICNDYVQENLINWYIELVSRYDFDKVEYDIIRYSVSNLSSFNSVEIIPDNAVINDPGYTEYSMNKFMEMYGLEGDLKVLIKDSLDVRNKWMKFKENELIKFITNATTAMKQINPNLKISAAVLNEYEKVKINYLQDAKKWLELGIVDMIEPMVYSDDYLFVVDKIDYYNSEFSEFDVRIGLSYGLTVNELMMQLEASSSNGYILFHTRDYLNRSFYNVIKSSFHFEYVSEISSSEEKKSAIISDLIDKIENYYEEKNNLEYEELINSLINYDYNKIINYLAKLYDEGMKNYIYKIVLQIESIV